MLFIFVEILRFCVMYFNYNNNWYKNKVQAGFRNELSQKHEVIFSFQITDIVMKTNICFNEFTCLI